MRIYLDLVVILNFLVDFLLLWGTNRLVGFPTPWRRTLAAAALGGLYGGACLLPGFRFLGNSLWRIVALILMGVLAFGWNRSMPRRCGVFLILTMALGGMALRMENLGAAGLLICGGGLWLLCRLAFGTGVGREEYIPMTITYRGRREELIALRDTGNTLLDPVTGEGVLVIAAEAASRLTGLTREQLRAPLETLAQRPLPGLRLIPYHSVGNGGAMMLAMRFPDIRLGPVRKSALVAFAPEGLGREGMVQALTGGSLWV